jgi:hypothetical protein
MAHVKFGSQKIGGKLKDVPVRKSRQVGYRLLLNEAIYLSSQPCEASVLLCSFMPDKAIVKSRVAVQGYDKSVSRY